MSKKQNRRKSKPRPRQRPAPGQPVPGAPDLATPWVIRASSQRAATSPPSAAGQQPRNLVTQPPSAAASSGGAAVAVRDREQADGPLEAYLQRVAPLVVPVTYWFHPATNSSAVTIRFTGRRLAVEGLPGKDDQFVHDETVTGLVPGSGPVALTVKVRVATPGEWMVDAQVVPQRSARHISPPGGRGDLAVPTLHRARWSLPRWRLTEAPANSVSTCLSPFTPQPGVVPGIWVPFVALGIIAALVTQSLVIKARDLPLDHVIAVSSLTVLGGIIGAKAWFLAIHRRDRRREGWAVQGFVAVVAVLAPALLAIFDEPIGVYLDVTAPGLMLGLAIGRLGCFLAGCCVGRPTSSRWGVWSSDRRKRIGARRIPAQLAESLLALGIGLVALAAVLSSGSRDGMLFVAAVAAYTVVRQGILSFRDAPRQSPRTSTAIAVVGAATLVGVLVSTAAGVGA